MRKVLVLILTLSLMGALYAVVNPKYEWQTGDVEGTASTEVFVDTTGTQKCVVGFSSDEPASLTDSVTAISDTGVKLDVSTDNGTAATSITFYLYYQIASGVDIDISMYGDDQLASTNNGNTDKVNWYVTVTAENNESPKTKKLSITGTSTMSGDDSGNGASNALLIHEHQPSPTTTETTDPWHSYNYGAYGGYAISIDTGIDSLWTKRADRYSANLYVVISSDATGEAGA